MDFSGVLNTVLTITTIIAGALAGLQRGVVQNLRETNKDLRDRAGDLEKERDEFEAKAHALSADLAALGRVVTGEAYLTVLGDELKQHHLEMKSHFAATTDLGRQILAKLDRISGET